MNSDQSIANPDYWPVVPDHQPDYEAPEDEVVPETRGTQLDVEPESEDSNDEPVARRMRFNPVASGSEDESEGRPY